jgi:hypothetical protein
LVAQLFLLFPPWAVSSSPSRAALYQVLRYQECGGSPLLAARRFRPGERVCCLLVLNSVTSTPQWIRQPKPRDVVHDVSVCQRSHCKECGGAGICPHQRQRNHCKECGGASICPHQRIRSQCKECGGAGICQHQRQRSTCKECGGAGHCPHQRRRSQCKECGGAGLCRTSARGAHAWAHGGTTARSCGCNGNGGS